MSELKACPFCGTEPKVCEQKESVAHPGNYFPEHVECKTCGVHITGVKAKDRWNTRANDDWIPVSVELPKGWGLRRHVDGEIVVSHKDGSGVLIRENSEDIAEILFYRMMDEFLTLPSPPTTEK